MRRRTESEVKVLAQRGEIDKLRIKELPTGGYAQIFQITDGGKEVALCMSRGSGLRVWRNLERLKAHVERTFEAIPVIEVEPFREDDQDWLDEFT